MVNVTKKHESTHLIVYDAMFCVLREDLLDAAGLGGSNAPYFAALGESIHTASEQPIHILLPISCAM